MKSIDAHLSPEWSAWITENLLRGAREQRVVAMLVEHGVPAAIAQAHVARVAGSPIFAGAAKLAAHTRRLETIARLMRRLASDAAAPESIPSVGTIDADAFFDSFYAANQPVVIRELTASWPARARWTPEFLAAKLGHVEVEITDDRERDPDYDMHVARHRRSIRIDALTQRILATDASNDFYVVANNRNMDRPELAPLYDDIVWPDMLDPDRRMGSVAFWYGPKGTITPLHHDTCNILFCQMYGRKRFTLFSPFETTLLEGARAMYAACDPERDALAGRRTVVLEPGDTLFIPVGWWHHVRALDASISIAFANFRRNNHLDWYRPGSV